ncbi:hypothetical protein GCM10010916_31150 [Paenibacillus abyssi]|uniref:Uncharacterized protein n=1 Tax=Paenibacillus abyssi TaxID=1340531 RepID=A0A917D7U2_9BACL|nr:hypothetical protein GCM10010916_31150 [Paenibacillus abyssi]
MEQDVQLQADRAVKAVKAASVPASSVLVVKAPPAVKAEDSVLTTIVLLSRTDQLPHRQEAVLLIPMLHALEETQEETIEKQIKTRARNALKIPVAAISEAATTVAAKITVVAAITKINRRARRLTIHQRKLSSAAI